jgi:hypothetical protein
MACIITCVTLAVVVLARITAPAHNPFTDQPVSGDLLWWDAASSRWLASFDDTTVWLRLKGSAVGERPAAGCLVRAMGITRERTEQHMPELVAAVLIVENCPLSGRREL